MPLITKKEKKNISSKRSSLKKFFQLMLIGISIGSIFGTTINSIKGIQESGGLSFPSLFKLIETQQSKNFIGKERLKTFKNIVKPNKEISDLSIYWEELLAKYADLEASAYLLLIDNGKYAQINPIKSLPAASSIKIHILLVALEMIDSGQLKWDELLELTKDVKAGGAGWMAYQPLGKTFEAHEVITEMIRVSDNTATNMIIKRLGGIDLINQRLKMIGLSSTKINNLLPDLEGTNLTSAGDLAKTIKLVDNGNILSLRSRDLFREVLSTSTTNSLIPLGLLRGINGKQVNPDYNLLIKGYRVYNKTGDIGISYADAGLIQMPDTSRAVAAFIVKGPFNDPRSPELIRKMAASMAKYLKADK